jgi:hypothetical protein
VVCSLSRNGNSRIFASLHVHGLVRVDRP